MQVDFVKIIYGESLPLDKLDVRKGAAKEPLSNGMKAERNIGDVKAVAG